MGAGRHSLRLGSVSALWVFLGLSIAWQFVGVGSNPVPEQGWDSAFCSLLEVQTLQHLWGAEAADEFTLNY